ncbi:hypothetical protein [Ferrimonas balearica]|uniref:hypothetical protein n=1 Tax=Ferrimonas balearica TaxID=44012 RepID=UPI001C994CB8|nr:hypothetical protein [Ferrimonas balearica]MBY5920940.1 hypothetical protein [Ferrimonas balearica]MBY5996375.1 hypothetical protein [Ferrimonas balearica]
MEWMQPFVSGKGGGTEPVNIYESAGEAVIDNMLGVFGTFISEYPGQTLILCIVIIVSLRMRNRRW